VRRAVIIEVQSDRRNVLETFIPESYTPAVAGG
jgi:hypothetical protein